MDCSRRLFAGACITPLESVRVFWIGICRSTGTASRRINQRPALLGPSRFGSDPVGCEFLSRSPPRMIQAVLHLAGFSIKELLPVLTLPVLTPHSRSPVKRRVCVQLKPPIAA